MIVEIFGGFGSVLENIQAFVELPRFRPAGQILLLADYQQDYGNRIKPVSTLAVWCSPLSTGISLLAQSANNLPVLLSDEVIRHPPFG
jgi:hypothetical protein